MRYILSGVIVMSLSFLGIGQVTVATEKLCSQAAIYFNSKKYELAYTAYSACLDADPKNAKSWYYLGNSAFNLKKYDEAIFAYDNAIRIKPDYFQAMLHKGYTQLFQEKWNASILTLTALIQKDNTQVKAFQYRGNAWMKSGRYQEAINDFNLVISQTEPNYSNYFNRGLCKAKLGEKYAALSDFRAASDINPKEVLPIIERVNIMMELQMWPEAISDATLALSKTPSNTELYFCRGYAKLMSNDLNGADIDFSICLQLDPNHMMALKNKSIATVNLKKYDEAILDLTNLIKKDSKNPNLFLQRGNCFLATQNFELALSDYNHAIQIKKDFGEAYFNRANIYSKIQNLKQACKDIKYAAEIGFEPANAYISFLCK